MKLLLPFPPSTNNLFLNPRHKGMGRPISAKYHKWRGRADDAMWQQKLEFFTVPVRIALTLEDNGRCDLDNLAKAVIDHAVRHQIIPGDDRKWVREVHLKWGNVKGCEMEILPA